MITTHWLCFTCRQTEHWLIWTNSLVCQDIGTALGTLLPSISPIQPNHTVTGMKDHRFHYNTELICMSLSQTIKSLSMETSHSRSKKGAKRGLGFLYVSKILSNWKTSVISDVSPTDLCNQEKHPIRLWSNQQDSDSVHPHVIKPVPHPHPPS